MVIGGTLEDSYCASVGLPLFKLKMFELSKLWFVLEYKV